MSTKKTNCWHKTTKKRITNVKTETESKTLFHWMKTSWKQSNHLLMKMFIASFVQWFKVKEMPTEVVTIK